MNKILNELQQDINNINKKEKLGKVYKPYVQRTYCAILEEMRELVKTGNTTPLLGLIEELQIVGNKMESSLDVNRDYHTVRSKLSKTVNKHRILTKEYNTLLRKAKCLSSIIEKIIKIYKKRG